MMYFLPCFTPYVAKVEIQYWFGWMFLGALAPLIVINFVYIIFSTIGVCLSSRKIAIKQGKIKRMQDLRKKAEMQAKTNEKANTIEENGMIYKRGSIAWKLNEAKKKEAQNFFGTPVMDKMNVADFRRTGYS